LVILSSYGPKVQSIEFPEILRLAATRAGPQAGRPQMAVAVGEGKSR
jgi:hypothetical protein